MPARGAQDQREHRRRRGLAVAPGDRDRACGWRRSPAACRRGAAPGCRARAAAPTSGLLVGDRGRDRRPRRAPSGRFAGVVADVRGRRRAARRRSSARDSRRSEPLTRWPMRASTVAIALMPAPPTPTMWMARGAREVEARRSRSARPRADLLDQVGEACGGVGAAERARGRAHRRAARPGRRAARRARASRRAASSSASGTITAAPAATSASALRGLVVAGRAGQRHEHRRHADRGELGGHAAGAAHHHRGLGVDGLHVLLERDEPVRRAGRPGARSAASRRAALFVVAGAGHMVDRDVGRGRASGRRGSSAASVERARRRGSRRRPRPAAASTGARRTAAIAGRIGLPVTTAPGSGVPGSDTAGAGAEAHRDAVGEAGVGVGLVDDRRDAPERAPRPAPGSDAYPPTPTTTARPQPAHERERARRTRPRCPTRCARFGAIARGRTRCARARARAGGRSRTRPRAPRSPRARAAAPTKRMRSRVVAARDELVGERERGKDVTAGAAAADQRRRSRSPSRGGRGAARVPGAA